LIVLLRAHHEVRDLEAIGLGLLLDRLEKLWPVLQNSGSSFAMNGMWLLCRRALSRANASVAAMDDIEGIRRLVFIYSELLDDWRLDEWQALFTEDAVFTVWGNEYSGRAAIREGIGGMTSEYPGKHVAFATVADFDGDQAWAWTDFASLADSGPGQWGRSYIVATVARVLRPRGSARWPVVVRSPSDTDGRRAAARVARAESR
jgi:hypothetical protein